MRDGGDRIAARLLREKLVALVRELAQNDKVFWADHTFERMEERDIDLLMAERALLRGDIEGDPRPGENEDEWVVKIVHQAKKNRDIGVVTVVIGEKRLLVITVEWEDL